MVSQPGIQNVKIGKCRDAICQGLLKQSLPRVQQNASRCSTRGGVVIVMVTVKKKVHFQPPLFYIYVLLSSATFFLEPASRVSAY